MIPDIPIIIKGCKRDWTASNMNIRFENQELPTQYLSSENLDLSIFNAVALNNS